MGKNIDRLRTTFAEPVIAVLLAAAGFALLGWPFVESARAAGDGALFWYYFLVWAVIVGFAGLLAWAAGSGEEDGDV